MIKRLKQSQVSTSLKHDGPVHFSVLRLKRKNKHSIYFETYFVSFRESELFEMLYFAGVTLINSQYLSSYTRYENNV